MKEKDLIKLNFARNGDTDAKDGGLGNGLGEMVDPVTFKVFTDNTHIVAIRHGTEANVFAWETVERLNIKAKMWKDLVDDQEFTRSDIITLQDPQNIESRNLSTFKFLKDGESVLTEKEQEERNKGSVNIDALGRVGDKILRAKDAVEKARKARENGADINRPGNKALARTGINGGTSSASRPGGIQEKKLAYNAAQYTTGATAASFTSTGLTPSTSNDRALLTDEEYMLRPKRIKTLGYARIETSVGHLTLELHPEFAPKAVWNFIQLSKKGYYKDVIFHRNIKNFMIQGGDPTGTGKGGTSIWGNNFADEFEGPLVHDARGTVSMANKGKNTNSSQFFITYAPTPHLNRKHTIFGKIVGAESLSILSKMEKQPVGKDNRPTEDLVMENVIVFVDPFEEFLKSKREKDAMEEEKREVERKGGAEDERVTWTGKRVRGDGSVVDEVEKGGVAKYLKSTATTVGGNEVSRNEIHRDDESLYAEPAKKKVRTGGGFGNFDGW